MRKRAVPAEAFDCACPFSLAAPEPWSTASHSAGPAVNPRRTFGVDCEALHERRVLSPMPGRPSDVRQSLSPASGGGSARGMKAGRVHLRRGGRQVVSVVTAPRRCSDSAPGLPSRRWHPGGPENKRAGARDCPCRRAHSCGAVGVRTPAIAPPGACCGTQSPMSAGRAGSDPSQARRAPPFPTAPRSGSAEQRLHHRLPGQ